MKIALYARVSKAIDQNPENQFNPLLNWIASTSHEHYKDPAHPLGIYVDETSSKDTRPKKEEVLRLMRLGVINGVAFVALDRWGRTASELVFELEEFARTGKSLISLKEGLDLSNAAGRLMANVLASMANFERDRIRERTIMGLARVKAQGKHIGRPSKNGKVYSTPAKEEVDLLYKQGLSIRDIAKQLNATRSYIANMTKKARMNDKLAKPSYDNPAIIPSMD
jgi:DNA invertase Pin-like site-specific DNA recombinase